MQTSRPSARSDRWMSLTIACIRLMSLVTLLVVIASLSFAQIGKKPLCYSGGQTYYTCGWPLPVGGDRNHVFNPFDWFNATRFAINMAVLLVLLASTFTVLAPCLRKGFRLRLGAVLHVLAASALTFAVLRIQPNVLWPLGEPPLVRPGLVVAFGCTILLITHVLTRSVLLHRPSTTDEAEKQTSRKGME